ncbi:MAG: cob(I)yrinic acid a,c-diamide adenosyltransferase [Holophagales bacterium]|jgi:cob(I)alamin adenosyltransferase|nr:cob(I)yrinic acid a,c-diamide adenosyltransferase [Holophagales bacterium]
MKIYTRAGDNGETSMIGGQRVSKSHPRLEAYGTLDELNSMLGILRASVSTKTNADILLENIQQDLFRLGAVLANPKFGADGGPAAEISLKCPVETMEADIDRLCAMSPVLNSFVLPSGSAGAAYAHYARSVCRRAERKIVPLCHDVRTFDLVIRYLNRLSDWLFALARAENAANGVDEEPVCIAD